MTDVQTIETTNDEPELTEEQIMEKNLTEEKVDRFILFAFSGMWVMLLVLVVLNVIPGWMGTALVIGSAFSYVWIVGGGLKLGVKP